MNINLREITLQDNEMLVKWRNDHNIREHFLNNESITQESQIEFYKRYILTGKYKQYIVEKVLDEYPVIYTIATVYLKNIDEINHRCEFGMYPSKDEEWNDEAKQIAIRMLLNKAFNDLGLYKVYSYVFADCSDEAQLLEKVGFRKEGYLKCEVFSENQFRDVIRYGIVQK